MTTYKLKIVSILTFASLLFVQCGIDEDFNDNVIEQDGTCEDGIQNGDEDGIDCGGTHCPPCEEEEINFDGVFVQEDVMGRPTINTFFSGTNTLKNEYNIIATSKRDTISADFQPVFETILENYYDVYALALSIDPEEFNYEANILEWDAETYTSIVAYYDALQVAPEGPTTYYDSNSGLVLTGRSLSDDVVDVSLMLMFGGTDGTRLDGTNGTPQLTTDEVDAGDRDFSLPFPYLETPLIVED